MLYRKPKKGDRLLLHTGRTIITVEKDWGNHYFNANKRFWSLVTRLETEEKPADAFVNIYRRDNGDIVSGHHPWAAYSDAVHHVVDFGLVLVGRINLADYVGHFCPDPDEKKWN